MEKQKVPETELRQKLQSPEALSGLLNLALEGVQRLEENDGDVSLPEGDWDRLKDYEKQADPMREFAHECVENTDGDYIVKEDVTTIYKQFASAQGYEIGSNIHDVLHRVLRSVVGLNYAETRPRTANYAGTDLPLRGWDERKHAVDRMTLTDEGLEYARQAGLVDDEEDGSDETGDDTVLEPGWKDLTVTVAEKLDNVGYQDGNGTLLRDGELIPYICEGENHLSDVPEGAKIRIENAKVGTDRDGLDQVSVRKVSTVAVLDDDQTGLDETDAHSGEATAADGGTETAEESEEYGVEHGDEGLRADADRLVHAVETQWEGDPQRGEVKTHMAGQYDTREDAAAWDAVIEYAMKEGRLTSPGGGRLRTV